MPRQFRVSKRVTARAGVKKSVGSSNTNTICLLERAGSQIYIVGNTGRTLVTEKSINNLKNFISGRTGTTKISTSGLSRAQINRISSNLSSGLNKNVSLIEQSNGDSFTSGYDILIQEKRK